MRTVVCQKCGIKMHFLKQEKIQLGQTGFFAGDWPNILAGALDVEIYCCSKCGKIEFYRPEELTFDDEISSDSECLPPDSGKHLVGVSRDGVPQVRCRACGKTHDFDYPNCPYCNIENR